MSLQWVSNGVVLFYINIIGHGYALIIMIILVHKCFVSCTLITKMSTKSSVIGIHIIKREFYYFCNEYIICEYHEENYFISYSRKHIFLYMHQMLLRYGTHTSGRVPCSHYYNIDGLVQDCSNSIANALELLQSCTKPSICTTCFTFISHHITLSYHICWTPDSV